MTNRDRSAERYIESLAASEVPPLRPTEAKETAGREAAAKQAANNSFIGSVSGDVIFFGEVPPNALEMILARRAQRQQKS